MIADQSIAFQKPLEAAKIEQPPGGKFVNPPLDTIKS